MTRPNLRIVHSSDSHTFDFSHLIPECDVFIHSGDGTSSGTGTQVLNLFYQLKEVAEKAKHVIFVPGNHDVVFEAKPERIPELVGMCDLPDNVHILNLEGVEIEGYKFYGNSYTPEFYNWAFNLPRRGNRMKKIYEEMPKDIDVLINHGPPHGILDWEVYGGENVGCEVFKQYIPTLKNLKLCCFGHIHESYGQVRINETIFSNGSLVNHKYESWKLNKPHEYELTDTRAEFL